MRGMGRAGVPGTPPERKLDCRRSPSPARRRGSMTKGMELIPAPSPNFEPRTAPPNMIVLHYTGMQSGQAALDRLRDPEAKVSSHYLVEEDGRVFSLVAEERCAWHAGVSFWKGRRNLNDVSIGIEIVNPGHEFGYRAFPEAQVAAVLELVREIRSRWTIEDNQIVGHSDI